MPLPDEYRRSSYDKNNANVRPEKAGGYLLPIGNWPFSYDIHGMVAVGIVRRRRDSCRPSHMLSSARWNYQGCFSTTSSEGKEVSIRRGLRE